MNLTDKLARARMDAVLDHRFFGQLIMRMKMIPSATVEWAATDGKNLLYNPETLDTLSFNELLGVLVHEVMHCALGHLWRVRDRNPIKFNVAADAIINPIVLGAGMKLPDWVVTPESLNAKYGTKIDKTMSAEQVYSLLPDQVIQDYSWLGGMLKPEGVSEEEWARATAAAAKAAGNTPKGLEDFIDQLNNPKVDWRSALQLLLQRCLMYDDYTWRMPSRRYTPLGLYIPSLTSERADEVSIYVDASGSCWAPEVLSEFGGEASGILAQCKPERMFVDYFDTVVHEGNVFEPGDDVTIRPKGGGGTNFQCIFDHVEESGRNPAAVVVLTDGYGFGWPDEPSYPVIWAINSKVVAPWGTTIDIREN